MSQVNIQQLEKTMIYPHRTTEKWEQRKQSGKEDELPTANARLAFALCAACAVTKTGETYFFLWLMLRLWLVLQKGWAEWPLEWLLVLRDLASALKLAAMLPESPLADVTGFQKAQAPFSQWLCLAINGNCLCMCRRGWRTNLCWKVLCWYEWAWK